MKIQNSWYVILEILLLRNIKIIVLFCFQYNQYFIELYEVYSLCLKNFSQFSTLSLTKLLFDQLAYTKNEFGIKIFYKFFCLTMFVNSVKMCFSVLLQVNMKCLTLLTENPKNIDTDLVKMYLSQLVSLQTILTNEKSLQRSYLVILNHILHYTILVPNVRFSLFL